jgi:hypothetical protein
MENHPNEISPTKRRYSRRKFIAAASTAAALTPAILDAQVPTEIGDPMRPYGDRSPFEKSARVSNSPLKATGASLTPLQDLDGFITPRLFISSATIPEFRQSIRRSMNC